MKKVLIAVCLLSTLTTALCQPQTQNDSLVAHFDLLNNLPFAQLQLEDSSGAIFNTYSLSGKTLYVDFWFTSCAPCIKEIPHLKELYSQFASDTSVVFLGICIESNEKKAVWKQMVKDKQLPGVQLFYARNRPQKINLLRRYFITFPTYLLVNKEMKVIGYDAPRPSEKNWVSWAIHKAKDGVRLSKCYKDAMNGSEEYKAFIRNLPDVTTTNG